MKNELEYQKLNGLFVFCNKCKKNIHHNKKGNDCKHPINRQVYKAIVRIPDSGYDRKTKVLKSRDFDKAMKEFLDFKEQVKNPILYEQSNKNIQSQYLKDAIAMYIDYMQDEEVHHHMKKYNTQNPI